MGAFKSLGPDSRTARISGLLYLVVVITGAFSILYVPAQLFDPDAATTVNNIRAATGLFRLSIVAAFVCYTAFLLLPLALHQLLQHVSRPAAVLMVAFAVVSVPISLLNMSNKLDVISLLGSSPYLHGFTTEQLDAHVMLALESHANGMRVAEIFWGLWLLPFGYLVFKSGMIPRALGALLMLGCFGYLVDVLGNTLSAEYPHSLFAGLVSLPGGLGEIGTCLWLLILGVRSK